MLKKLELGRTEPSFVIRVDAVIRVASGLKRGREAQTMPSATCMTAYTSDLEKEGVRSLGT